MKELFAIIYFDFKYLQRSLLIWLLLIVSIILVPLSIGKIFIESSAITWATFFHAQTVTLLTVFPFLVSHLFKEEMNQFVPSIILTKVKHRSSYIVAKCFIYWIVPLLYIVVVDIALLFVTANTQTSLMGLFFRFMLVLIPTVGFYAQLTILFFILFRKLMYCVLLLFFLLFVSILTSIPYVSIWFNPTLIYEYLCGNGLTSFYYSRCLLFVLGIIVMLVNAKWFDRRILR